MPIAHPYITSTIYLNLNPIIKYNDRDVIKSACNRIYCSYNKKKYDHIFYLSYDNENNRWSKTIASIKKGGTKVHISGYYLGYSSKEDKNSSLFHAIQLTELDFESKFDKFTNNDDDDDFFFDQSSSKNKSSKLKSTLSTPSTSSTPSNKNKKHQISSLSEKTEFLDKKYKKSKKSLSKSKSIPIKFTTFTQTLSYDDNPSLLQSTSQHFHSESSPNSSHSSLVTDSANLEYIHESSQEMEKIESSKNERSVRFKLITEEENEDKNDNLIKSLSKNKKRGNKNIQSETKATRVLRSNPRKKSVMSITVNKIVDKDVIEVDNEDELN